MPEIDLAADQALWLLTAHPDTWELSEAPDWLIRECHALGLVRPGDRPGTWKKTAQAHEAVGEI